MNFLKADPPITRLLLKKHLQNPIPYRRAAKRAPRPTTAPEAALIEPAAPVEEAAAPDDELVEEPPLELESESELESEPEPEPEPLEFEFEFEFEPDEPAPEFPLEPDAPPVPTAPSTCVVELATLMVKVDMAVPLPMVRVLRPVGRPAGMVAFSGWLVTAAGCAGIEVAATAALDRVGMPVTTPSELVMSVYKVSGLE